MIKSSEYEEPIRRADIMRVTKSRISTWLWHIKRMPFEFPSDSSTIENC